jgi:hypothetical protein
MRASDDSEGARGALSQRSAGQAARFAGRPASQSFARYRRVREDRAGGSRKKRSTDQVNENGIVLVRAEFHEDRLVLDFEKPGQERLEEGWSLQVSESGRVWRRDVDDTVVGKRAQSLPDLGVVVWRVRFGGVFVLAEVGADEEVRGALTEMPGDRIGSLVVEAETVDQRSVLW